MVKLNRTRIDFLEEFQRMIDEYNAGSSNVEAFFAKLMAFAKKLNEEEKRGLAEQLTEEELVIFDLLTKPDLKLTKTGNGGSEEGGEGAPGKAESGKAGTGLAKATDHQSDGIHYDQGYPGPASKGLHARKSTIRSAIWCSSISMSRTWDKARACMR